VKAFFLRSPLLLREVTPCTYVATTRNKQLQNLNPKPFHQQPGQCHPRRRAHPTARAHAAGSWVRCSEARRSWQGCQPEPGAPTPTALPAYAHTLSAAPTAWRLQPAPPPRVLLSCPWTMQCHSASRQAQHGCREHQAWHGWNQQRQQVRQQRPALRAPGLMSASSGAAQSCRAQAGAAAMHTARLAT
jgi:hypothetical protein